MPNPFLDLKKETGSNPFLKKSSSENVTKSQIDASLPTVSSELTGDASYMQNLGKDKPGFEYGDILPFEKNTSTGDVSLAMPEAIRAPLRGVGNLISKAQMKSTDSDPDALSAMLMMGTGFKPAAKIATKATESIGKNLIDAVSKTRDAVNAKSDAMAAKVPIDKEHAEVIKILKKEGHSDEDIVNIVNRAKQYGMTVGEASNNPKLLGMERKISGLTQPGGKTVRDFVKNRVDPNNNVGVPYKLKSIADPLVKKVAEASQKIGEIVKSAPNVPISMEKVASSIKNEPRPPKSPVTNTLNRLDELVQWAHQQGDSFAAWHRVKQEIWNLRDEAGSPTAVEKLDKATVNKYYKQVNEVLGGKTGGLPEELHKTASDYASANAAFGKNLGGRTIQNVLEKMPTGGSSSSSLKYLYKQLVGSKELQEELFSGIPEAQHEDLIKFLEAIKDSSRSEARDVVKSMEDGTPSFPSSWNAVLGKFKDKIIDTIRRKDYDALANALISPDAELIAKKLKYVKSPSPQKPILRLTYQPKDSEIAVGRSGEAKIVSETEQASINQARDRMLKLGFDPGVLRAQDLNAIRELETKYGQSELGKFVIANKNEPIMGRIWEVPQTEYSQAQADRLMRNSDWQKLDKAQKARINAETETAWNSHQVTLADMILARRQAAKELAKAKGEPVKTTAMGEALMKAANKDQIPSSLGQNFNSFLGNQ